MMFWRDMPILLALRDVSLAGIPPEALRTAGALERHLIECGRTSNTDAAWRALMRFKADVATRDNTMKYRPSRRKEVA